MNSILSVSDLSKTFNNLLAVNQLNFDLKQGEILGFLGLNGAGKTTTMRMLTGFIEPSGGKIFFQNKESPSQSNELKQSLGYLPEGCPLYADMRVLDFLKFMATIHGLTPPHVMQRLEYVVSRLGLEPVAYRTIRTLSKGFKRRIGLAQAIIHDPKLLILDEPTDGLDPLQQDEVYSLLKELAHNKAIILSTHNLEEAQLLASRVLIIHKGKNAAFDTPDAITKNTPNAKNFSDAFKILTRSQG